MLACDVFVYADARLSCVSVRGGLAFRWTFGCLACAMSVNKHARYCRRVALFAVAAYSRCGSLEKMSCAAVPSA